ncbi:unnamed protein product [Polarella glacialis]|uniref:Sulfatase N-terminal domain-containing protein n=1 Tax=Polarella glacialis TaxID=89957 RepID=A0A813IWK6_POLGL|nr:unnamed protein product [Polarella glacialis]
MSLTVALLLCSTSLVAAAEQKKPHIVLILADDHGWANFGVHTRNAADEGNADVQQQRKETQTPNMDALVDAGVLLERHYAYKICAPSRASLQSGRLAVHVNTVNTGVTVQNPADPVSGYAGVGKWDAGMATPEHTPDGRGYDSWIGFFQHANDYWRKNMPMQATGEIDNCLNTFKDLFMHNATFRGGVQDGTSYSPKCLKDPESHIECYEEYLFKERALAIIKEHDASKPESPLFLFYAFHLVHTPLQVPKEYLRKLDQMVAAAGGQNISSRNRRLYAAMNLYMDEAIGEVVKALKAKSMWEDTLVVFTSDNGGPVYVPGSANNYPLKGGKYSDWEGGVRTNAFMSGGFIPQALRGTKFSGVVSIADWYGTFCELAGVESTDDAALAANVWLTKKGLPLLAPVDSVPQWQFILNSSNGRSNPLHLSRNAMLHWPYKLVTGKQFFSAWTGPLYPNCTTINGTASDEGPFFPDLKVFDAVIPLSESQKVVDRVTWAYDCGSGCLFNIEKDPTEHDDLARKPESADTLLSMQAQLETFNKKNFSPKRGEPQVQACETAMDNGGFYGPFVEIKGWYSPFPHRTPLQQNRDEDTMRRLRIVNKEIVQEGIADAGRNLYPKIRKAWTKSMDKCLCLVWLVGWFVGWLVAWLLGLLVCWLVGWLLAWLGGWVGGRMGGWVGG